MPADGLVPQNATEMLVADDTLQILQFKCEGNAYWMQDPSYSLGRGIPFDFIKIHHLCGKVTSNITESFFIVPNSILYSLFH